MSRFKSSRFTGGGSGGGTYLANGAAIPSGWEAAGTTTVGGVTFTAIRQIVQAVAPAIATQPSITGGTTTGSVLTLAQGAASGSPAPTGTIQWLRGATAISGATSATYTLVAADVGQAISARVTWTNSAGSVQATSNAITGQAPATAPAKVTGLTYAAPELTWAAPANGGSAITRYDVEIVAAAASFTGTPTGTSTTTALDVSAQAAGNWQARVRAVNAVGNGPWSDPATFTKAPAAIAYQPDMTTGRIAPITTSFGGRPNVTPATYYFDGQDEMAAMAMGA